ncbi:hypothetical protein KJ695_05145, partial [Patescibacteria group bacterium]|nr:hypothetical protein [Patescibacteria group bacterium]
DNWGEEQIKNRAKYLVKMIINDILPISDELKTNNNYSFEKRRVGNRFSFEKIGLIGKEIVYFDDDLITAEVLSDKEVKFEDKVWRLSPLARELETRKNRRNKSGAYWGVDKWKYQGRRLDKWSQEVSDESEYDEDSQNE